MRNIIGLSHRKDVSLGFHCAYTQSTELYRCYQPKQIFHHLEQQLHVLFRSSSQVVVQHLDAWVSKGSQIPSWTPRDHHVLESEVVSQLFLPHLALPNQNILHLTLMDLLQYYWYLQYNKSKAYLLVSAPKISPVLDVLSSQNFNPWRCPSYLLAKLTCMCDFVLWSHSHCNLNEKPKFWSYHV